MKPVLAIGILLIAFTGYSQDTQIVVNPDGTHSVVIKNGNIATVVHPNGTHSTIFDYCSVAGKVNPNERQGTNIKNDYITMVVHSNGTHSTIINHSKKISNINSNATSRIDGESTKLSQVSKVLRQCITWLYLLFL
jgi:hypothetical protein